MSDALPTEYRGVRMRSRLEARWAAFFCELGWGWEYEPLDLAWYIPDFVLRFYKPLLVEIKPAISIDHLRSETTKIGASGWDGEALIVGLTPMLGEGGLCGILREGYDPKAPGSTWEEALLFECLNCGRPSVRSNDGSWRCRVCGCHRGKRHIAERVFYDQWASAVNAVQWRAPQ